jgi:MFS family permease
VQPVSARSRDFRLLWFGQTVSELGSQVSAVALPLIAVITLHASAVQTGLLAASETLPFLLVGLPAGVLADRVRRRRVLIVTDLVRALLLASIPVAAAADLLSITQLCVVALVTGIFTVLFDVTYQAYLPTLVRREDLMAANSQLGTTSAAAQVAGPGVAGVLVQALGGPAALLVDAVSFVIAGGATTAISHREPAVPPVAEGVTIRAQIVEGLQFVLQHRLLRRIVACTATANLSSGIWAAVMAIFLVRTLHASAATVGLVLAVGSAGGLLGAVLAGSLARWLGTARMIWLPMMTTAPLAMAIPFAQPGGGIALAMLGLAGTSFTAVVYNIAQVSYRQSVCPIDLQGRMNASVRTIVWGVLPVGALIGGAIGSLASPRSAVGVGSLGTSLSGLWVFFSPLRRLRDVPTEAEPGVVGDDVSP